MMNNWRFAFISLCWLVLFSRPACMQISWDAANICNDEGGSICSKYNMGYNDYLLYTVYNNTLDNVHTIAKPHWLVSIADPSDPIHQWDVELPDCSADSVRVVYSNHSGVDGRVLGYLRTYVEIRLNCTAPGGTAQVGRVWTMQRTLWEKGPVLID